MYTQNIQAELAAYFPDIQFWPTHRPVDLTGDVLKLIIPNECAKRQGFLIFTEQGCQVKLALSFCVYKDKNKIGILHYKYT